MEHISTKTSILKDAFIIAIKFVLNSTFFAFNNKFYKQVFGGFTSMDSPLSLIIADIVIQDLEEVAIMKLQNHYFITDISISFLHFHLIRSMTYLLLILYIHGCNLLWRLTLTIN